MVATYSDNRRAWRCGRRYGKRATILGPVQRFTRTGGTSVAPECGASISATTLIHEAYLGMSTKEAEFPDRARFMAYAARVMRGLIIDLVRERRALKRGAEFHITQLPTEIEQPGVEDGELARLSDALDELALHDPRVAETVDLKISADLPSRRSPRSAAPRSAPCSAIGKRLVSSFFSN